MSHIDAQSLCDNNINFDSSKENARGRSGEKSLPVGADKSMRRQKAVNDTGAEVSKGASAKGREAAKRKCANRSDARFVRQESLIRRGLEKALEQRRIGLKTAELCRDAKVSSQTFYIHYHDCDDALTQYELMLEEEFVWVLTGKTKRDVAWTLLLNFIAKHQMYFTSTIRSRDLYLLTRLISYVCERERKLTNERTYSLYVGSVEAIIVCWGEHDHFAMEKMEAYRKKLMMLRLMDYGW